MSSAVIDVFSLASALCSTSSCLASRGAKALSRASSRSLSGRSATGVFDMMAMVE